MISRAKWFLLAVLLYVPMSLLIAWDLRNMQREQERNLMSNKKGD
jgi:hypothetical protein